MILEKIRYRLKMALLSRRTRAVVRDKRTYLSFAKLRRLEQALAATRKIDGDLLEFGVALGGSGIVMASKRGRTRRFIGFDVFGMIPPPTSDKDDNKSRERYETIVSGKSEGLGGEQYYGYRNDLYDEVKATFARHGVPVDGRSVQLCKGLFEDSWPSVDVDAIAIAHIDCDWYDPVLYCLNACADRMRPGGIIVIDDYNDYGGCRTAVDEFIARRPDFSLEPGANPFLRKAPA